MDQKRNILLFLFFISITCLSRSLDPIYQNYPQYSLTYNAETKHARNANNALKGFWEVLGPPGGRISRIQVDAASDTVLLGTWVGGAFLSTNGGGFWQPLYADDEYYYQQEIFDICRSRNDIYIATWHNILKGSIGKTSWKSLNFSLQVPFTSILIHPDNPNILFASTDNMNGEGTPNGFLRSDDGGNTWRTCNNGLGNYSIIRHIIRNISMPRPAMVYILIDPVALMDGSNYHRLFQTDMFCLLLKVRRILNIYVLVRLTERMKVITMENIGNDSI